MYKLKLTEQELNNLKIFLSRATLTGAEVAEFSILIYKINNAEYNEEEGD